MDHFHEMAGADGTGVQITAFDARIASLAVGRLGDRARAMRQGREYRVQAVDDILFAADHHAIAALQPPDTAGGADIDIMDGFGPQFRRAPQIVPVEAVAAVDQRIPCVEMACQFQDGALGHFTGRQHQPHGARGFERGDKGGE